MMMKSVNGLERRWTITVIVIAMDYENGIYYLFLRFRNYAVTIATR